MDTQDQKDEVKQEVEKKPEEVKKTEPKDAE